MKYALRVLLFIALLLLAVLAVTGICVIGFKIAEASGNVYVIASEGMQVRAATILMPNDAKTGDITKYFTSECIAEDYALRDNPYIGDRITSFDHRATVQSIWAQPWNNKATVTLTETVNTIRGTHLTGEVDENGLQKETACAPWEKRQYKLTLRYAQQRWLIEKLEILAVLEPDPTPTQEPPMSDVRTTTTTTTATPEPTLSPSALPGTSLAPVG